MKVLDLPPVWLAYFMLGAYAAEATLPLNAIPASSIVGWGLIILGVTLAAWAAIEFGRARTAVMPRNTPSAIVTSGPYRFSRNPIYVADAMILIGWGALLGSLWPLLLVLPFCWVIQERFIKSEEAELRRVFPAQWTAWASETRRWL